MSSTVHAAPPSLTVTPTRRRDIGHAIVDRLDRAGTATLAGAVAGLFALGLGSRVAMRVVALTSGRIGSGVRPDSGAVPGEVTFSGTSFLLLAGATIGLVLGLLVMAGLGRWVDDTRPRSRWLLAPVAAAMPTFVLLDPNNIDFGLFGPTWLAISLFLALPVAYGIAVVVLTARFHARRRRGRVATGLRRLVGAAGLAIGVLGTVGIVLQSMWLVPAVALAWAGLLAPAPGRAGAVTTRIAPMGRAALGVLAVASVGYVVARVWLVAQAAG